MLKLAAIAAVCCLAPLSAWANWQNTSWGMSRAQVIAAVGQPDSAQPCQNGVTGTHPFTISLPYQAAGFRFRACLIGNDENGLTEVSLSPDIRETAQPGDFLDALIRKYGKPAQAHPFDGATESTWHDGGDQVVLTVFVASDGPGAIVMIDYKPLPAASTKGL